MMIENEEGGEPIHRKCGHDMVIYIINVYSLTPHLKKHEPSENSHGLFTLTELVFVYHADY